MKMLIKPAEVCINFLGKNVIPLAVIKAALYK
jgi:hypothetical protein